METTIGSRLVALRNRAALSLAELAKAAGYAGPSSIQSYFRDDFEGPLGVLIAQKIANALEGKGNPPIQRDEIFDLTHLGMPIGENPDSAADYETFLNREGRGPQRRASGRSAYSGPRSIDLFDIPKDLPSYSTRMDWWSGTTTVGGEDIILEENEVDTRKVLKNFRRPPSLHGSTEAYIHYVQGASMEPRFEEGEAILVDPRHPIRARDYVIVILSTEVQNSGEPEVRSGVLRRLVKRAPEYVELEQFNPPAIFRIPTNEIKDVVPVRPWVDAIDF